MEKKRYKVSLAGQDFYFVSDDSEEVVNCAIKDTLENLNNLFRNQKDCTGTEKIQFLMLGLVQLHIDVNLLHKELDEYRQKEKDLVVYLESVSSVTQI